MGVPPARAKPRVGRVGAGGPSRRALASASYLRLTGCLALSSAGCGPSGAGRAVPRAPEGRFRRPGRGQSCRWGEWGGWARRHPASAGLRNTPAPHRHRARTRSAQGTLTHGPVSSRSREANHPKPPEGPVEILAFGVQADEKPLITRAFAYHHPVHPSTSSSPTTPPPSPPATRSSPPASTAISAPTSWRTSPPAAPGWSPSAPPASTTSTSTSPNASASPSPASPPTPRTPSRSSPGPSPWRSTAVSSAPPPAPATSTSA